MDFMHERCPRTMTWAGSPAAGRRSPQVCETTNFSSRSGRCFGLVSEDVTGEAQTGSGT